MWRKTWSVICQCGSLPSMRTDRAAVQRPTRHGGDDSPAPLVAIGQVLSFGGGVSLSPIPIVGVVLILGAPRARAKGLALRTPLVGR